MSERRQVTPAYAEGARLGALMEAFRQAAEQMAAGFKAGGEAVRKAQKGFRSSEALLEMRERESIRRYNRAIEKERLLARLFMASLVEKNKAEGW